MELCAIEKFSLLDPDPGGKMNADQIPSPDSTLCRIQTYVVLDCVVRRNVVRPTVRVSSFRIRNTGFKTAQKGTVDQRGSLHK